MKMLEKWQWGSIFAVGILVLFFGFSSIDNSQAGIYGGESASDALSSFPPFSQLLYQASPWRPIVFDAQASSTVKRAYGFLSIANNDGTFYVPFVLSESPAGKAGLSAGDTVYAINGTKLSQTNTGLLLRQMDEKESVRLQVGATSSSHSVVFSKANIDVPPGFTYVSGQATDESYFRNQDGTLKRLESISDLNALAEHIATHPTEWVIERALYAPFVLALFWMCIEAVFVLVFGFELQLTSRIHNRWLRWLSNAVLFVASVILATFGSLQLGKNPTFEMLLMGGVLESSGFLNLAGAFEIIFVGIWLFFIFNIVPIAIAIQHLTLYIRKRWSSR